MVEIVTIEKSLKKCVSTMGAKTTKYVDDTLEWEATANQKLLEENAIAKYKLEGVEQRTYSKVMEFKSKDAKAMLKRAGLTPAQARTEMARARFQGEKIVSTKSKHTNKLGEWTKKRQALHDKAVKFFVPDDATDGTHVILSGGRPGSGKGGVLKLDKYAKRYPKPVKLDPDEIKSFLASADGVQNVSIEAAAYQEESVKVFLEAQQRAMAKGKVIEMDSTMRQAKKMNTILDGFENARYTTEIAFADLSSEKAMERAIGRFLGQIDKETGKRVFGRFVDPVYIGTHGKNNITIFNQFKKRVNVWSHYATDVPFGVDPKLVGSGVKDTKLARQIARGTPSKRSSNKAIRTARMINLSARAVPSEKRELLDRRGEKAEDFDIFWAVSDGEDNLLDAIEQIYVLNGCHNCENYNDKDGTCPAFPNKVIPEDFKVGRTLHTKNVKGQVNGILFREKEEA